MHRQALVRWIQTGAPGDGPTLQHPVKLQPEVIVEPARRVLLDEIALAGLTACLAGRLRCFGEVPLGAVPGKSGSSRGVYSGHEAKTSDQSSRSISASSEPS